MGLEYRYDQKICSLRGSEVSWVVVQLSAEPLSAASGVVTAYLAFFLPWQSLHKAKSGTEQNRTYACASSQFKYSGPLIRSLSLLYCCFVLLALSVSSGEFIEV